jgi:hypothetical protein
MIIGQATLIKNGQSILRKGDDLFGICVHLRPSASICVQLIFFFVFRQDRLCIDLTGERPRLSIPAECEKGNRDRLLPLTPDFAAHLLATPDDQRRGPVFRPLMPSGNRAASEQAGWMVSIIGDLAGVVVHIDSRTGKVKFASAHDLRRTFGTRDGPRRSCLPFCVNSCGMKALTPQWDITSI